MTTFRKTDSYEELNTELMWWAWHFKLLPAMPASHIKAGLSPDCSTYDPVLWIQFLDQQWKMLQVLEPMFPI